MTAGGRCAPIFACVWGLKPHEMPFDEIVICEVKGLVAASTMTGSTEKGYIVFIRGQYENLVDSHHNSEELHNSATSTSTTVDDTLFLSKESRVAKLYRENVYYPFLQKIRTEEYDMPTDLPEVPANLTAMSWMDGCHGQLKLTTTEDVLKTEEKL